MDTSDDDRRVLLGYPLQLQIKWYGNYDCDDHYVDFHSLTEDPQFETRNRQIREYIILNIDHVLRDKHPDVFEHNPNNGGPNIDVSYYYGKFFSKNRSSIWERPRILHFMVGPYQCRLIPKKIELYKI